MSKTANNPAVYADEVIERLHAVPWAITCFLHFRRNVGSFKLHCFRANDPEAGRLSVTPGYYEVGTYSLKGVRKAELIQDFLDTMARAR